MISGLKKTLKTTIMLDLAISIASGRDFLGRFAVWKQMPVAVMSYESGKRNLQETMRRIRTAKALSGPQVPGLAVCRTLPKIDQPKQLEEIRRFLRDTGAKILFLDNVYLCMSGADWSNASIISNKLHDVKCVCDEFGALFVYTHHNRKTLPNPFAPTDLDDCSGAGFAEFSGQWLLLARQMKYDDTGIHPLYLRAGSREDSGHLCTLKITEGRKSDPGGRHYAVTWETADENRFNKQEAKKALRVQNAIDKITAALQKAPNGLLTKAAITAATKVQKELLDLAISSMTSAGTIGPPVKELCPGNGQFYDAFPLLKVNPV